MTAISNIGCISMSPSITNEERRLLIFEITRRYFLGVINQIHQLIIYHRDNNLKIINKQFEQIIVTTAKVPPERKLYPSFQGSNMNRPTFGLPVFNEYL